MTSQASRTAYDGYEQRRAPITRPLSSVSHGSIHRHHVNHVNHALTPHVPPYYSGPLSLETYPDEALASQRMSPPVERVSALCEEIAATTNEREAIQLVLARLADLVDGRSVSSVEVLVDQGSMVQSNSRIDENLSSLRAYTQTAGVVDVALMSGGAQLGVLRIVSHAADMLATRDSHMLRLVGVALAQALECHRLRAALDRHGAHSTDAASSHEGHEHWEAFLGRVAHEVKTPLTCINGYAQLIRRYVRTARDAATGELTLNSAARVVDACERHLPPLERQVAHIERLTHAMLDMAQIEHGPLTLALERCDFVALLRRAIHDVDGFEHCQLALTVPDAAWLTCDARRIEQALYDVLHYAIRVGGYGGTLCVGVAERRLNGARHVMAVIGTRHHPPTVDDCAILSRREMRMLRDHVVAGVERVPAPPVFGLALSATISRVHSGNLYHLPPTSMGDVFVLALPVRGPRAT